jgi:polyisoprenoid-binding protein YceI
MKRTVLIVLGVVLGLAVLAVGGTWLYINVFKEDAPEELSFADLDETTVAPATTAAGAGDGAATTATPATTAAETAGDGIEGRWTVSPDSIVGYRVKEVLFGQDTEGVGRTSAVTGGLTITGTTLSEADFTVDMASIESDESRRDGQFRGRIMDVEQFPTATFVLTAPIELGAVPADGEVVSADATGDLTLRGTTQSVTFPLQARLNGGRIEVDGSIPVVFAEWGIPNPSFGPVSTEDNGLLEFLLVFAR